MLLKFTAFATTVLISVSANAEPLFHKYEPQIEFGGKLGNERSIGTGKMMIPLSQTDDSLLFTDIRGRIDDNSSEEFNLGLGYRKQVSFGENKAIIGGYGFYDRLYSENNNQYKQITLGFEALTENYEARVNYYIPENDENQVSAGLVVSGGSIGMRSGFERALGGFDGEVGVKVPVKKYDLRVYAGGYHFEEDGFEEVAGPSGRIELTLDEGNISRLPAGSELTFGIEAQYDDVRDDQYYALAEFRIPFGYDAGSNRITKSTKYSLSALDKRMTKFIERDVDIVTGTPRTEDENIIIDGNTYSTYVTVDSTDNITTEVTNAGANSLVLLDGTSGTIDTGTAVVMASGQTLISGGQTITVTGATSGRTATGALPGGAATISGTNAGVDVIETANNSTIHGVSIIGGRDSILNSSTDTVTLRNISIAGSADDGIQSNDSNNLTIIGGTITNTNDDGVVLNRESNVLIDGLTLNDTGGDGVFVNNGADIITINNTTVGNTTGSAFSLTPNGTDIDNLSGSDNIVNGSGAYCSYSEGSKIDGFIGIIDSSSCG